MTSYGYSGNDIVYDDRAAHIDHEEKKYDPYAEGAHEGPEDPFGDEEFAEVKYRTLRWWYVLFPLYPPV